MMTPQSKKLRDSGAAAVSHIVNLFGTTYGKKLNANPKKHKENMPTAATNGCQQPISLVRGNFLNCK